MNAVARAQLTFQMLTLLKKYISPQGETLCLYGVTWIKHGNVPVYIYHFVLQTKV